jgi:hypothetical protein
MAACHPSARRSLNLSIQALVNRRAVGLHSDGRQAEVGLDSEKIVVVELCLRAMRPQLMCAVLPAEDGTARRALVKQTRLRSTAGALHHRPLQDRMISSACPPCSCLVSSHCVDAASYYQSGKQRAEEMTVECHVFRDGPCQKKWWKGDQEIIDFPQNT